jgi:hypothetical protein
MDVEISEFEQKKIGVVNIQILFTNTDTNMVFKANVDMAMHIFVSGNNCISEF